MGYEIVDFYGRITYYSSYKGELIRDLESLLKDSHSEKRLAAYQKLLTADKIISLMLIINDSNKFFEKVGDSIIMSGGKF